MKRLALCAVLVVLVVGGSAFAQGSRSDPFDLLRGPTCVNASVALHGREGEDVGGGVVLCLAAIKTEIQDLQLAVWFLAYALPASIVIAGLNIGFAIRKTATPYAPKARRSEGM